jgi:hypothetical protein
LLFEDLCNEFKDLIDLCYFKFCGLKSVINGLCKIRCIMGKKNKLLGPLERIGMWIKLIGRPKYKLLKIQIWTFIVEFKKMKI